MGLPQEKIPFSAEDFLAWEAEQMDKHEYLDGEVFDRVGVRQDHVIASGNMFAILRDHLRGTPCRALMSDMKLNVQAMNAFYYPDVMVTCHAGDKAAALFIQHPKLIVEVLSDSTQAYDRGAKFAAYRKIDSLEEYVLVDIERRSVESFRRQADERWLLRDFAGEKSCVLESVSLTLSMARLFEDVEPMQTAEG